MPRRILLLITDLEIGGTPTVVRELAVRLNDPPDVVVEVACLKRWGPVADQLTDAGIQVTAFGATRILRLPSVVRRLRALIDARGIDTVFSFLLHANAVAAIASRKLDGIRWLQSIQTIQPNPRWHWFVQRLIHGRAEHMVVPSTAVARVAVERCDLPPGKIVVIPNALDLAEYSPTNVFAGPITRIGFLGRLDPVKRLSDFVQLATCATRRDPMIKAYVFGDGPERAYLERFRSVITIHGPVARPQDALKQMDVLFLPSLGEGFGLVLIEAMAAGVPVIARPAGGVTDVVTDGVDGFLIGKHLLRDDELYECVVRLRNDADLRRRIIDAALETVRKRFTWEAVLPLYRKLLGIETQS